LDNRSSFILLACPYHRSWYFYAPFTTVSLGLLFISLVVSFGSPLPPTIHDILHVLHSASISSAANLFFSAFVHLRISDSYNTIIFIIVLYILYSLFLNLTLCHHIPLSHFVTFCLCPILSRIPFISSIRSNSHAKVFIIITYCNCLIPS
jgi:hypothetical protein